MVPVAVLLFGLFSVPTINSAPADEGRRRVTYISLQGNCPGAFLVDVSLKSLDECKQHCGVLSQCAGFSYSKTRDICYLKKQTCSDPVMGSEYVFYQKFDPSLTEIPKMISEAEDPESFFRQPNLDYESLVSSPDHGSQHDLTNPGDESIGLMGSNRRRNATNLWKQFQTGGTNTPCSSGDCGSYNPLLRQGVIAATAVTVPQPDCSLNAGSGSEYVLMFMFNQPDQPQLFDLEIYVSGEPTPDNVATEIQISMPRFPSYPGDRGTVNPGQTIMFKLPQSVRMTQTGIDSKAIRIIARNPNAKIQVYAMNKETYTSDGFLVFPTSQLGLEHYIMTWQPSTRGSEFGFAVPYDNTVVQVILPAVPPPGSEPALITFNGRTYTNGETMQVSLSANDAFLAMNENLNSDLTGTRVISNRPLAVFSGDKRTAIKYISGSPPTRDHLVEQLPPVNSWGTEFVFCTSPNRTDGDFMKIVASQDATQVLVYGGVSGAQQRTIPSASLFVLIETAPQECLYISTTKPVMVGKFVVSQKPDQNVEKTDPAAVIIPPTSTYRSAYAFLTPSYGGLTPGESYTHFILIGVKRDFRDGFIVDGRPVALQQTVPTYNDYICGYLLVPAGQHSIQHSMPNAKFLAILYGAADRESYAFVLGETLPTLCTPQAPCQPGTLLGTCPYCQEASIAQGCYGNILSLTCPVNRVVKVVSAHYGWFPGICGGSACGPVQQGNCGMYNVYDNIARFCNGQSSCNFPVATNALFSNPQFSNYFCPLCSTRVQVHYICIPPAALPCANLVGRTPLFVRYTASSFWRREPSRSDITCPDDISMLTPIDAMAIPAYLPEFARYAAPHGLMWCPSECDTNSSYIQVDLGKVVRVSGYAIQGRVGFEQWVSSVAIDYSVDGRTWMTVSNKPGTPPQQSLGMVSGNMAVFEGNNDAENVVVCDLTAFTIDARYVRAWIKTYQGYPCMRFDVFTCGDQPQPTNQSFPIQPPLIITQFPIFPPVTQPPATMPTMPTLPATPAVITLQPPPPTPPTEAPIPPGCPPLAIANSDATGAPSQRGVIGQRAVVRCNTEWMLPDFSIEFTAICDTTGNWVGADYQCTEVRSCGPIPDVDNARYTVQGDPLRVGGIVSYTCDPGYRPIGNTVLTCQANTLWTSIPRCDPS